MYATAMACMCIATAMTTQHSSLSHVHSNWNKWLNLYSKRNDFSRFDIQQIVHVFPSTVRWWTVWAESPKVRCWFPLWLIVWTMKFMIICASCHPGVPSCHPTAIFDDDIAAQTSDLTDTPWEFQNTAHAVCAHYPVTQCVTSTAAQCR